MRQFYSVLHDLNIFLHVTNPTNLTYLTDLTSDFRENLIAMNRMAQLIVIYYIYYVDLRCAIDTFAENGAMQNALDTC